MGSVYAALFAEAGHDVWAIDQWAEHVDAINRDGLTLTGFTGDRTVTMSASTSVADAGTCDMYVIATKAAGAGAAAKSIAPFVATDTNVVTIQNGLGAAARITEHIPSDAVVVGVAQGFGAAMVGPGHSHQNGMKMLRLGELAKAHEHSGETARLDKVASTFHSTTRWPMSTRSSPRCPTPNHRCCKTTRTGVAASWTRSMVRWSSKAAKRESRHHTTMRSAAR